MEIVQQINMKLCEYNKDADFKYAPLRISMDIRPPLYLSSPYIQFDGIIAYLCMRDCLGELFYNLPSERLIDVGNMMLPLKKTGELYHASVGLFHDPILKKDTIYKRFTDKEAYHLSDKKQQKKIPVDRGYYKDFMLNLPLIITDKVIFYCNGDKQEVTRLLSHLFFIGKKTSIGGGKIINCNVEELEDDYSFYSPDGELIKPYPVDLLEKPVIASGVTYGRATYKPPYWNKAVKMCQLPQNQLI